MKWLISMGCGVWLLSLVACGPSTVVTPQENLPGQTSSPTETQPRPATGTAPPPPPATDTTMPFLVQTPTPQAATQASIEPGLIAFYSDRDGNPEIYVIHSDGSGLARLTNDPAFDDSPAVSPDGRQIAFLTARHDPDPQFPNLKYELYLMDINGNHLRRLTETEAAENHPAWSPDGSQISFDADYDGDGFAEIYTIDPDGTGLTRLTSSTANDQFADWSPDGSRIAFASDRNGNWDLFVMDVDGANQQPLTVSPNWELFPAWSPDGSQIAFNGLVPRSRNTDIFILDVSAGAASGSNMVRQLTDSPAFDENPAWSPDGSEIAFQTQRDGQFELYVMNPDGSAQRPLIEDPADELWPSWGALGPAAAPATPVGASVAFGEIGIGATFGAQAVTISIFTAINR